MKDVIGGGRVSSTAELKTGHATWQTERMRPMQYTEQKLQVLPRYMWISIAVIATYFIWQFVR